MDERPVVAWAAPTMGFSSRRILIPTRLVRWLGEGVLDAHLGSYNWAEVHPSPMPPVGRLPYSGD